MFNTQRGKYAFQQATYFHEARFFRWCMISDALLPGRSSDLSVKCCTHDHGMELQICSTLSNLFHWLLDIMRYTMCCKMQKIKYLTPIKTFLSSSCSAIKSHLNTHMNLRYSEIIRAGWGVSLPLHYYFCFNEKWIIWQPCCWAAWTCLHAILIHACQRCHTNCAG